MSGVKRLIRQRHVRETHNKTHNKTHVAKLDLHYDTSVNPSRLPTEEATAKSRPKTPKSARFRLLARLRIGVHIT